MDVTSKQILMVWKWGGFQLAPAKRFYRWDSRRWQDAATNTLVATIPVGINPVGAAITPSGAFVYLTNFGSNSVSVINTSTNTVTATVSGAAGGPSGVAVRPDGAFAYVTLLNSNALAVINTVTNTVTTLVGTGTFPNGVAITPNGAFAYVTNQGSNNVSVINTATNTVAATIPVGSIPSSIASHRTAPLRMQLILVPTACRSSTRQPTPWLTRSGLAGLAPNGVAISSDGALVYVTNFNSNNVSVINTATNTVIATVAVGSGPIGVAITPILIPELVCSGFKASFDQPLAFKKKTNRTIPLKIELTDAGGFVVTDQSIVAPPVVNVLFNGQVFGIVPPDDTDLLPPGAANEKTMFRFDIASNHWIYNLGTKQFPATGTYTVSVASADNFEYKLTASGACAQTFERLP